ncbi:hypothetical protein BJY01DRAFT_206744 [Aspergillus pseudoustus]|uniref:Uncharacterized protein n=1 Tax=Aspergillus pseudoustus TaxID=1810923 RepID=A0ABR4KNS8_9EURO
MSPSALCTAQSKTFKSRNQKISCQASQKLQYSMLELGTTIDRIIVHNLVEYYPMFLYNCASTTLALHIERSLSQALDVQNMVLASLRIQTNLELLRRLSKSWVSISWAVQMFEVVIRRTGLVVTVANEPTFSARISGPIQRRCEWGGWPRPKR